MIMKSSTPTRDLAAHSGAKLLAFAAFVSWIIFAHAAPSSAIDPFYERLMREGSSLLQAGDYLGAAKKLELACFGMLDEPPVLTRCQIHLALAYGGGDDQDGFTETFERLAHLERDFSTLSSLELSEDYRHSLEQHAKRWIPYATLRALPPFARVARQQLEASILDLPVEERREKLTILLQEEPNALGWRILMAQVDLATGQYQDAADEAKQVLQQDSELLGAICVRGQAQAALGQCADALSHLYACDEAATNETFTLYKARCHLQLEQLDEAEAIARALPSGPRRTLLRDIQRARRTIEQRRRNAPAEAEEKGGDIPADPGATEETTEGVSGGSSEPMPSR